MTIKIIFTLLCLTVSLNAYAQIGEGGSDYDKRVSSKLDNLGIKYQIIEKGRFKIPFDMGNGRTQIVVVNSSTEEYNGIEIREVFSIAAAVDSKSTLSHNNLFTLLELNDTYKIGGWQIQGGGSPYILKFTIKLGANAPQSVLGDMIRLAALTADDMEKRLSDEDTY